jgi:hypothetical protein
MGLELCAGFSRFEGVCAKVVFGRTANFVSEDVATFFGGMCALGNCLGFVVYSDFTNSG